MKKLTLALSLSLAASLLGCAVEATSPEPTASPEEQQNAGQGLSNGARQTAQVTDPQLPGTMFPVRGIRRVDAVVQPSDRITNDAVLDERLIPNKIFRRKGAVIVPSDDPDAPSPYDMK